MARPTSLLDRYRDRLASMPRPEEANLDLSEVRRSYHRAAAVLDCFTFPGLMPADAAATTQDARSLLFDDVVPVAGGDSGPRYTLKLELRRAALKEMRTRGAMAIALESNPDRLLTPLQNLWELYVASGELPPLDDLSFDEAAQVCQLISWLDGLDPKLPPLELAERRLRRQSVYASFEHLVVRDFVGRAGELAMLRDHVGTLPPSRGFAAAVVQLLEWGGLSPKPILMLHGVGGIGKSALIGRLLWEHAEVDDQARFPFAYLAFDQPWLRVDAPHTMLTEAAAQLELQFPQHRAAFHAFRDRVLHFRDSRGSLHRGRASISTRVSQGTLGNTYDNALFSAFADLLHVLGRRTVQRRTVEAPVVLVFDTFEEVQYRDREVLGRFWRMLDRLQEHYKPLRAIVCGRAAVSSLPMNAPKMREERLAELETPDRILLLQRLGVQDARIAEAIAGQVGGNPLTLRLAANVATNEQEQVGIKGIDSLVTRRLLFLQLDETLIQGQLYQRVLNHIHDERVRSLAHPGMVLRRIDPMIILEVLAPVCLPQLRSFEEAVAVFEELKREHTLVWVDTRDDALVYRADIRSALLRLLERDRLPEVRRLRRAAIAYYEKQEGDIARGEELFHRLALGEDEPWVLDSCWDDSARPALASSLDEFSDPMKAWLASRMSLEVPRSVFRSVDLSQWERNTTRKVQLAIADGQPEVARTLLAERDERSPASPLYALEAKLLMDRPAWLTAAADVLERGISSVTSTSNRGRLAELFWLRAQLCLTPPNSDPAGCDASLAEAQRAIERASNPVPLLHVVGQRLLLRRDYPKVVSAAREALEHTLAGVCERLSVEQVHAAGIAAALAWTLIEERLYPKAKHRLEPALGSFKSHLEFAFDLLAEDLQGLDEYREPWELEAANASRASTA